ncbi:MAG: hypothetical protein WAM28_03940 [Chlamydiales bacterium]
MYIYGVICFNENANSIEGDTDYGIEWHDTFSNAVNYIRKHAEYNQLTMFVTRGVKGHRNGAGELFSIYPFTSEIAEKDMATVQKARKVYDEYSHHQLKGNLEADLKAVYAPGRQKNERAM